MNIASRNLTIVAGLFLLTVIPELVSGYQGFDVINESPQIIHDSNLPDEKMRQEIIKLQLENEKLSSKWGLIQSLAPFITALAAAGGIFLTVWKQINESSRQKELDRRQRETENMRKSDERFASIISNLGSDNSVLKASASVSIMTFLKPEYKDFHEQVFLILIANLKIGHETVVNKLLVNAFRLAIIRYLEYERDAGRKIELDLSHCKLDRADLSELELNHADMGFSRFRGANLSNANLFRARGMKADLSAARLSRANLNEARFRSAQFRDAQFHETNIIAADLKETNLRNAQFQQAKMQSAHLDNAMLNGAEFEQANVSDAFFKGAVFDEHALKSIIKAKNWRNAHFDDAIKARLESLANNYS